MILYPMMSLDDSILWQALNSRGREVWSQMLPKGIDPMPYVKACVSGEITKCEADDPRVLAAQEASFT
jgi:hypothetical protein